MMVGDSESCIELSDVDDTGFLLEENDSAILLDAQVDRVDDRPMRAPRWMYAERLWSADYSAAPAQVILRFRGGAR